MVSSFKIFKQTENLKTKILKIALILLGLFFWMHSFRYFPDLKLERSCKIGFESIGYKIPDDYTKSCKRDHLLVISGSTCRNGQQKECDKWGAGKPTRSVVFISEDQSCKGTGNQKAQYVCVFVEKQFFLRPNQSARYEHTHKIRTFIDNTIRALSAKFPINAHLHQIRIDNLVQRNFNDLTYYDPTRFVTAETAILEDQRKYPYLYPLAKDLIKLPK